MSDRERAERAERERDEALARGRAEGVASVLFFIEELARADEGHTVECREHDMPDEERRYELAARRLRTIVTAIRVGHSLPEHADALARLLREAAARALEEAADMFAPVGLAGERTHFVPAVNVWNRLRERAATLRSGPKPGEGK